MTAFGSHSSTFLNKCKIPYSSICLSYNLQNLFLIVLLITAGIPKETGAGWECLAAGAASLPEKTSASFLRRSDLRHPRQKLNVASKPFLSSFYIKAQLQTFWKQQLCRHEGRDPSIRALRELLDTVMPPLIFWKAPSAFLFISGHRVCSLWQTWMYCWVPQPWVPFHTGFITRYISPRYGVLSATLLCAITG